MDWCRSLALNLYMGSVYGGLLYFVSDFSVVLAVQDTSWNGLVQYPRYCMASLLATILYISSLPFLKWSMAKESYRLTVWKLNMKNILFFSAVLPLATFTCTEGFSFWIIGPDPLAEKRFHTLFAQGFCMTFLLEVFGIFETYRQEYLQELVD